ncbi:glycerol-3-phosphate dehydrogenase/oxidase [Longirhabdus pacifica]|uniref:glycerol-3-phosphate dehydrogenase/oxidase n=1 Tax=Longirhabdus pacifica TaxID=2305227 RepID=UPI001008711B|nr:glycerol-3-phosphate dehydrogenase/oxidase [Longirhabdus pacifica]
MKNKFSSLKREDIISDIKENQLDVLVIGGGITGAGIALDGVTRGLNIGVVDMQDFAAGTSSRSTKLVHGGLRYLKQFEVKLVAEVGKERAIVYENGPHVTTPEWMLLPFYKGGTFGPFSTSIGLRVYDFLAGVKKEERRKMLSVQETMEKESLLKKEDLKGSGYYVEYRTDDARLTIEVMKEAVKRGAKALNYSKVESFIYENSKIVGVNVKDQLTHETYAIYAHYIINAAGPWVDELRTEDKSRTGKSLHLTKGVHLVFDQSRFPLKQAIYFDTPDKRMVFAIPRDGKTYVGTTDTTYTNNIEHPRMTEDDLHYIIKSIDFMFPEIKIKAEDVESSWAGLRPLIHEDGKDPSEISRKDEIFESPSGLLSIAGGKLTGYRKMAENIINLITTKIQENGGQHYPPSTTKNMPISGGDVGGSKQFPAFVKENIEKGVALRLSKETAQMLTHRYGSNVHHLYDNIQLLNKIDCELNLPNEVGAMLKYSLEEEMTCTPLDFFIRRTGALFFDIQWVHQHKAAVINHMAEVLQWTEEEKEQHTKELEKHLHDAVHPAKDDQEA